MNKNFGIKMEHHKFIRTKTYKHGHVYRMTKKDFDDLLYFFKKLNFQENDYYIRITLLIFSVSQGLRPSVGIETPFSDVCLNVKNCRDSLEKFFRDRHLNLGIWENEYVYDTTLPKDFMKIRPNEEIGYYIGRILGYWTPITSEEYANDNPKNSFNIDVFFNNEWYFLTSFVSESPFEFTLEKVLKYREAMNIIDIPINKLKINLGYSNPEKEIVVSVAEIFF